MHLYKHPGPALALSALLLAGAMALALAAPQKKTPKKPAKPSASASLVAEGKKLFASKGCTQCHAVGMKGGRMGPALTHIGKEKKADWLAAQIRDPKKHNPSGRMPAFGEDQISAKDLKALVAYLGSLK